MTTPSDEMNGIQLRRAHEMIPPSRAMQATRFQSARGFRRVKWRLLGGHEHGIRVVRVEPAAAWIMVETCHAVTGEALSPRHSSAA